MHRLARDSASISGAFAPTGIPIKAQVETMERIPKTIPGM